MLAQSTNPAPRAGTPSAPGQFADRLAHWANVASSLASVKGEFNSVRASVRAVVESREVQS